MKNIEELKKIKNALEVLINESEKPKFEVGKKYLIINGCDGVRVLDGKICTFINKPKTKPNYYGGCIFEDSEYFFIYDDVVYGFRDIASYEIVKTKTIDEIAKDFKEIYFSSNNSIRINFINFLTENKQDIINALNNL